MQFMVCDVTDGADKKWLSANEIRDLFVGVLGLDASDFQIKVEQGEWVSGKEYLAFNPDIEDLVGSGNAANYPGAGFAKIAFGAGVFKGTEVFDPDTLESNTVTFSIKINGFEPASWTGDIDTRPAP